MTDAQDGFAILADEAINALFIARLWIDDLAANGDGDGRVLRAGVAVDRATGAVKRGIAAWMGERGLSADPRWLNGVGGETAVQKLTGIS